MAMRAISNDVAAQGLQQRRVTEREAMDPKMKAVAETADLISAIFFGAITCFATTVITGSLVAGNIVGTMVFLAALFSERTSVSIWPDFSFYDSDVVHVPSTRRHTHVHVSTPPTVHVHQEPSTSWFGGDWGFGGGFGGGSVGYTGTTVDSTPSSNVSSNDGTGHAVVGGRKTTT